MNTELLQQQHYDEIATAYGAHYGDRFSQEYRVKFFYQPMFENIDLFGCDVLEAMCGSGEASEYLLGKGSRVTGLDISTVEINAFRRRWPQCEAICGSILDSGLASESFDFVAVVGGLHHLHPNLHQAIQQIHRLLKPGGYFCFAEPHTGSAADWIRQLWYRYDKLFARNEAAVDVAALKKEFFSQFEFRKETYRGNVAYLLVLNSMVFRIPLRLKPLYSPILIGVEALLSNIQSKVFSCFVIAQWRKK